MSRIIIYGSRYGTTRRYAEELAERTGIPVISYEEINDLSGYETIIHMGGLYAGGVMGLKNTMKALPKNANFIIVTVGLSDVNDEKNIENIRMSIRRQLPGEIYDHARIFHLRGGIDYQKLNFAHRTMMTLLYNKAKKLPEEKKTAEVRAMIETFNQKVDFVDFHSLDQIIDIL